MHARSVYASLTGLPGFVTLPLGGLSELKNRTTKNLSLLLKKSGLERSFVVLKYCLFMYKKVRFVQTLLTFCKRGCYNRAYTQAGWKIVQHNSHYVSVRLFPMRGIGFFIAIFENL